MHKILIILFSLLFSFNCQADFEIRQACLNDLDAEKNQGTVLKFYASLLAYNNDKPRCILNNAVLPAEEFDEAVTHNDPQTNDIIVDIILSEKGKALFSDFSSQKDPGEIALILDNKILAMLELPRPITDGKIQIRGLWYEDAIRLSNAVNQK